MEAVSVKMGSIKVLYLEKKFGEVSDLYVVKTLEALHGTIKIILEEALVSLLVLLTMDQGLDQTIPGQMVLSMAICLNKIQASCILRVHLSFTK